MVYCEATDESLRCKNKIRKQENRGPPKELVPHLWTTTMMIAGLREVARASVKIDHFMQV